MSDRLGDKGDRELFYWKVSLIPPVAEEGEKEGTSPFREEHQGP